MGEEITPTVLLHDDEHLDEEAEEALSLRDLPLDLDANNNNNNNPQKAALLGRSSSETGVGAPDFFEFLSDLSSDMCPADDLILCGKLLPFKQQQQQQKRSLPFQTDHHGIGNHVMRKRSESLSELRSLTRSNSTRNYSSSTTLLRNSLSLDYQKLRRADNMSTRSVEKLDFSPKKTVKPRWYVFMFGMVKFPPEMEFKDMKSRQFRRSPSSMFSFMEEEDGSKTFSGNRSSGTGKGTFSSWNLLKALSCKDHTSVAVTSSFGMPQA